MSRSVLLGLLVLSLSACSLPKGSVALFESGPPPAFEASVEAIPDEWQGRLIRVGMNEATLGGVDSHRHTISHKHETASETSMESKRPLGIRKETADLTHTHNVASFATDPATSAYANHLPPSYGLVGHLVSEWFIHNVPENLIVGYIGEALPPGWLWCDGLNETPDLRDRFIVLSPPLGPMGKRYHTHNATHTHTWAAADNKDRPAFVRDRTEPRPPILTSTSRVHGHEIGRVTDGSSSTDEAENIPPNIALRFIMATPEVEAMPEGAVIPYSKNRAPLGWTNIKTRYGDDVVDRLLKSVGSSGTPGLFDGSLSHDHQFTSKHNVRLKAPSTSGPSDSVGPGVPVPTSDHGHDAVVEELSQTGPADHLPPYVSLLVIVKN